MSDKLFGLDQYFYHKSIRRYVSLFGTLFTDIYVKRVSDDGEITQTIKIPVRYGAGNMYLKAPQDESRDEKQISRVLPAIAYELENFYKDVSRKTNPMNRITNPVTDATGTKNWQFNRIPYSFIFALSIRTKNSDDMMQIIEQIVPAFDGNLSVTIEDTTGVEVEQDIIISLEEIDIHDDFDDEMQSRLLEYKITFELKGFLYKRTRNSFVIKEIDIQKISEDGYVFESEVVTENNITGQQIVLSQMNSVLDGLSST